MSYRFFFSYARETYKASKCAGGANYLDEFFDDLCNQVALLTGERIEDVAYRDIDRVRISDKWGPALIEGMQDSAVLVCVITPHYLKSRPCGREVGMFRERLALLNHQPGHDRHRIIPVFWINEPHCHADMHPHVKEFLRALQLTQKGLPEDYPRIGICDFYGQGTKASCYSFRKHLAERIKELSELPPLPKLVAGSDFNGLASFFERRERVGDERVAVGPLGTNVVYAVATRDDVAGDVRAAATYGGRAEDWRPFVDKPNRTIGLLTQAALMDAGQRDTEYCSINLSEELLARIKNARQANSPVLMILDRASLRVEAIKKHLADYDSYDAPHIGLVTAGGTAAEEPLLQQVFAAKYPSKPHHLWSVPPSSDVYEHSIADVVSALRTVLQKLSEATVTLPPAAMPSLTQPGA